MREMDSGRKPKVSFVIAGTQKGGTTALDSYLRQHHEICMADSKEVHFFDTEENFLSAPDYSTYHSFFNPRPTDRILGEATPIYMYWHDAARRIWEYNPAMKVIVLLRNPITRAFSHWNMETRRRDDDVSFLFALQHETERCRIAAPFQHRVYSYQDRGFYSEQLRRLWRFFPKKQVLVLKSESLRDNPRQSLDEICNFLSVTPFPTIHPLNVRPGHYRTAINRAEYEFLRDAFFGEIKAIERMLGWDCADWLEAPDDYKEWSRNTL